MNSKKGRQLEISILSFLCEINTLLSSWLLFHNRSVVFLPQSIQEKENPVFCNSFAILLFKSLIL